MWFEERAKKHIQTNKPKFLVCCMQCKVQLPLLHRPPRLLSDLLEGKHPRIKHFIENIRPYNMLHSFTSKEGKVQAPSTQCREPYCSRPKFSQLYIYDTENEIDNRKAIGNQS